MSTSPATHESFLVVGGCGFLGRHIVEQLVGRGETKVAVFDLVQRHFDSNITFFTGDISKLEDVTNAIEKSGATIVIHTASPTHGLGAAIYERVNVTGTEHVITACRALRVPKLVYTSSAGVIYSGLENLVNADERLPYPPTPLDAYNDTKARAERLALDANDPAAKHGPAPFLTCALRPAGIFGPGDRQMISGFYDVVKNGQTKWQIGNNENLFDWTYVGNVAHAHLLAADRLGARYAITDFHAPLAPVNLSLGAQRIPTSAARPLGPKTDPSEHDLVLARRFAAGPGVNGDDDEADLRPVLRSKMDQFAGLADADAADEGPAVAGQAFFITNCEPVFFWDFARTLWRQLGHVPSFVIVMPAALGMALAFLAEMFSKLTGRTPGFTRYRVAFSIQHRYYDAERARRFLGYTPVVGVVDGMERWTSWYKGELAKQAAAGETEKTK
ncbi:erg26, C-3 sterol dehydrogenase [Cryptotrichosporon argae]